MTLMLILLFGFNDGSHEGANDWKLYSDTINQIYRDFSGSETQEELQSIIESINGNFNSLSYALVNEVSAGKLDPKDAAAHQYNAYFILINVCESTGQNDAALVILDHALKLVKGTMFEMELYMRKALIAEVTGNLELQIGALEKVKEHSLYPILPVYSKRVFNPIHADLAIAYKKRGDLDLAVESYTDYFVEKQEIQATITSWDLKQWTNFQSLITETDSAPVSSELNQFGESLESQLGKTNSLPSDTRQRVKQLSQDDKEIMGQNYESLRLREHTE
jgi:tetratricopeptide (TPR) repeat protein